MDKKESVNLVIEKPVTVDCPKHGKGIIDFSIKGHDESGSTLWSIEIGCAHCYALVMRKLTQRFMHDGEPLQNED